MVAIPTSAYPVNAAPLLRSGEFSDCIVEIVQAPVVASSGYSQLPSQRAPSAPSFHSASSTGGGLKQPKSPTRPQPKPKIWLGQFPASPSPKARAASAQAASAALGPGPAGGTRLAALPAHQLVLAAASPVLRDQLAAAGAVPGATPTATLRLRRRGALPAAELLLAHMYGRPLDWTSIKARSALDLAVLSYDHGMEPLQHACAARLLQVLALTRPAVQPGQALSAAAVAAAPESRGGRGAPPEPYIDVLSACADLPFEMSYNASFVQLAAAVRAALAEAYADFEAAWQLAPLRRAFVQLPLAAAVEILSSDHLVVHSESPVMLAAMSYDASRGGAASSGGGGAPVAAPGLLASVEMEAGGVEEGAEALRAPLSTAERMALYGTVRWHFLHTAGRPHEMNSFLRNALRRAPHVVPLLEHGYPGSLLGSAAAGGGGGLYPPPPRPGAVPELAAATAACTGANPPAASLLEFSRLSQALLSTGPPRSVGALATPGGLPLALQRPRPAHGKLVAGASYISLDVTYSVVREAVSRVAGRLAEAKRRREEWAKAAERMGGLVSSRSRSSRRGPAPPPPPALVAVEEDVVAPGLLYRDGYWWQMVVSVGPLCRYRMALAPHMLTTTSIASGGKPTPSAMAAAAAADAHETDTRLCCYVGVRPLLLLTEAEVEAVAGRAVPLGWGSDAAAAAEVASSVGGSSSGAVAADGAGIAAAAEGAAAAAALLPSAAHAEVLEIWNERDLPYGKVVLGPTEFSSGSGFRGTVGLFALGDALLDEGYWARVVSGPGAELRLRARLAGVY
ncbi:hypothetical protein HYH03_003480 [Edaphochlamys debaryana]|uniref:BTB domain-containing protein n=1 Tax=Edaphochlamys debaryana TaxID=47281 RepID=A0A835YHF4_9CHLO|nr:hypothetical protein HYH03_003480 [Edaphochlamys debaryana]|eukprot:KAG2498740.1 hypothetical protein HYH03_003480 [Edaphochlamys debaryana]